MTRIHPTALIASGADVAPDVEIGAYCVIGSRVRLAAGNVVGPHVVISDLRRAYRTLFLGVGERQDRLAAARLGAGPRALALIAFLENSARGCISSPRNRAAA